MIDRAIENSPPHVEMTGSPVDGDSVNYVVDLYWHGWDDDGAISHSEYAVDIPAQFTPEQIRDPATPGIEWTTTRDTRARLRFRAAPPESLDISPGMDPGDRAGAPHTFFVRVYDNEGAYSTVADRSFNAWTALPRTTILLPGRPASGAAIVTGCRFLTVRWTAVDPNGAGPAFRPERTEYRLIPLSSAFDMADANYIVHVNPGPSYPWVPVIGDSGVMTVVLPPPRCYALAFRSTDEAGGVESRFEFWRNTLLICSSSTSSPALPILQVHEPTLGTIQFPTAGETVGFDVVTGQCLQFTLSADASSYGGTIDGYRWCIDSAESPRDPAVPAGCTPWALVTVLPPICFESPGIRTVSFAALSGGPPCPPTNITAGTIRFTVLRRPFDPVTRTQRRG